MLGSIRMFGVCFWVRVCVYWQSSPPDVSPSSFARTPCRQTASATDRTAYQRSPGSTSCRSTGGGCRTIVPSRSADTSLSPSRAGTSYSICLPLRVRASSSDTTWWTAECSTAADGTERQGAEARPGVLWYQGGREGGAEEAEAVGWNRLDQRCWAARWRRTAGAEGPGAWLSGVVRAAAAVGRHTAVGAAQRCPAPTPVSPPSWTCGCACSNDIIVIW